MLRRFVAAAIGMLTLGSTWIDQYLKQDDAVDFYKIRDEIVCDEESENLPDLVNDDNFVAYTTKDGSSSAETCYIICKDGDDITVIKRTFRSGNAKVYTETLDDDQKEKLYDLLSDVVPQEAADSDADGASSQWAYLYYTDGGQTLRCSTENIFAES